MPRLNEFFAVTQSRSSTSLYSVSVENGVVKVVKIGLRGPSGVNVGEVLAERPKLGITRSLSFYPPHPRRPDISDDELDDFIIRYQDKFSSPIVALFRDKGMAQNCFDTLNLDWRDERWVDETKRVLAEIGDDHPNIRICKLDYVALFPEPQKKSA